MAVLDILAQHQAALITVCALFGLVVGSFVNVVALRLPRMLEAAWTTEARAILDLPQDEGGEAVSLLRPPSTCPHCGTRIRPWHNVPLLGWLWLRGRAACCGKPISVQYPLVELLCGVLAALCAWRFGWTPMLPCALALVWVLVAAAVVDMRTQLLPDVLTLPLLWLGLLVNVGGLVVPLEQAVIGAAAGYLFLWSVYWAFRLVTGKEGMGFGDFKLLAALGAWFGWPALPALLLLSSLVGALWGIALRISGRLGAGAAMPFGPFIAGAGIWYLLFPVPFGLGW